MIQNLQERVRAFSRRTDSGFTLLEVVVALVLAGVMFAALAGASIAALRGAAVARQNTQATDIGNAVLEDARTQGYTGLSMVSSDLSGDPRILSGNRISVPNVGTEDLVVGVTGVIADHIVEQSANGVEFTVATYVSVPSGTTLDGEGVPAAKRVTSFITWSSYGVSRTRTASTILVETKRGLPLPDYSVALRTPSCSSWSTGSTQRPVFSVLFRNVGARDSFDLSLITGSNDSGGNWGFFTSDPTLPGTPTPASDTNGNGTDDTGVVESYSAKPIWVMRNDPLAVGQTVTLRLRAQSTAQPSAATAIVTLPSSSSSTLSVASVSGNVTGCSTTPSSDPSPGPDASCPTTPAAAAVVGSTGYSANAFGLNNGDGTIDGDTTAPSFSSASNGSATKTNSMVQANCTPQASDHDFSTNYATSGFTVGRTLRSGGTGSATDTTDRQIEWQTYPSPLTVGNTTHYLSVMVQCTQSSPTSGALAASLWSLRNNGAYNSLFSSSSGNSASFTCDTGGDWQQVNVPIQVSTATSIGSGNARGMAVRLWQPSGPTIRVGYDLLAGGVAANKSFASLQVKAS